MSIYNEAFREISENKKKRESGQLIAIPFPFKRFSKFVPGIQKGRYVICTANSKVGKTKFTDFLFMYGPLDFIMEAKKRGIDLGIDVRINYFCLEMSKLDKMREAISYYLYTKKNITLPPDRMDSVYQDYILSDEYLDKISELRDLFDFFENKVTFHDHIRNPFGIYKEVRKVAHRNGYYTDKDGVVLDTQKIEEGKDTEYMKRIFRYVPNDENVYYINIIDHYSLMSPEKKHYSHKDPLREAIKEFSAYYCLAIRDRWKHTVVGIQQQANAQESTENYKLNKLRPSGTGLADCKDTQRDVDMMLGLFAPNRHKLNEWNGYNIEQLGDFYRELSVINHRRGTDVATNLWFNGASNYFEELPKPDDILNIDNIYIKTQAIKTNLYG